MAWASGMTNLWWFTPSGYIVDRDEKEMKYLDLENTGMIRIVQKDGINWVFHEYVSDKMDFIALHFMSLVPGFGICIVAGVVGSNVRGQMVPLLCRGALVLVHRS